MVKLKLTRTDGSVLEVEGSVEECSAIAGLASIGSTPAPIHNHYHYHYDIKDWASPGVIPLAPWTQTPWPWAPSWIGGNENITYPTVTGLAVQNPNEVK